jgi:hypothetical protein
MIDWTSEEFNQRFTNLECPPLPEVKEISFPINKWDADLKRQIAAQDERGKSWDKSVKDLPDIEFTFS